MDTMEKYYFWRERNLEDPALTKELQDIVGDEEAINDRFYKDLEFGTGGLRGVLGAGTNRMNIYTVRRATQGIAEWLKSQYKSSSVAIAYDSRNNSERFAKEAASVFAANGIKVYITPELMPTPFLSFLVRRKHCKSGVVITASHNPAKYNGYKAYGSDGSQLGLADSEIVIGYINRLDFFSGIRTMPFEAALKSNMIEYVSDSLVNEFLDAAQSQSIRPEVCKEADLSVVYTPLNGAGNKPVRAILSRMGIEKVTVVPSQENPDGNFPTCPYPNPEVREALAEGLKLCETAKADLLLATDPDSDRVGIAVRCGEEYKLLTGNEVGALLTDYILAGRKEKGTLPDNPIVIKTIVTTGLIDRIAAQYGAQVVDVLTGFKFIGEQMTMLAEKKEENRYVFGFEESYGYLAGTHARDKDGVTASMLVCEMASYYKLQGMTLCDAMEKLYQTHGYFLHPQDNFYFEGESGMKEMNRIMESLRKEPLQRIGGLRVVRRTDILRSESVNTLTGERTKVDLPSSNVLLYTLEDDEGVVVRPSGTEPKIKFYYTAVAGSRAEAEALLEHLRADMNALIGK